MEDNSFPLICVHFIGEIEGLGELGPITRNFSF